LACPARLRIESLEDRRLLATVTWDGGGDGRLWSDPLNWDANSLPSTDDRVVIPNIAATAAVEFNASAGTVQVRSVQSDEPLTISGGSLASTDGIELRSRATMTGGTLQGAGSITVAGLFTWNGGTVRGANSNELMRLTGGMAIASGLPILHTRRLELESNTSWTGGEIRLNGPAEIHNLAGRTFDVAANVILNDVAAAATESFHNFGTIRRSAGTGRATWDARLHHHGGA
jgi:hypothetical protein